MFFLKMFRVFSAVVLLCVCGVCVCVSAERADLPRDFGVKLCGREFIRAVIFTCGGSRWRRTATQHGHLLLDAYQDAQDRDEELSLNAEPSLSELLLPVMSDRQTDDRRRDTLDWPRPDRRKRNFSLGLAGMCCNQGCTKNDIGRLC
ncbi:relaxin-3-like protein [Labeo rohita]|uniref:Relaxin-3-like protein n=1 Tax=Labeo rohita TaxID=84645 RepID=A0A498LJA8_LABRO|nr:relaxin-3-like protein [Labeo rohita]RXN18860.1 relaxin-3-like protein [Labeo rohita]